MTGELNVRVLGPMRAERADCPIRLSPRQTVLMSILLIEHGRVVSADRLVDRLWGPSAPAGAAATLRSHISNLRRALSSPDENGSSVLVTTGTGGGAGYQLRMPSECVDAHRFEDSYRTARELVLAGEAGAAVATIDTALALWRGPAYADVSDRPFALAEVARLDGLRRAARRTYTEALTALGRHAEVIGELTSAIMADPYDEAVRRLLATALYREQRVDEAATVCRDGIGLLRQRGLDSPALQDLHRTILRRALPVGTEQPGGPPSAPSGVTATPDPPPPRPPAGAPAQLPLGVRGFSGRGEELAQLDAALSAAGTPPQAVTVCVLSGTAGIGKTSLAVHWARRVADRFPDGQLYLNLRGFDAEAKLDPADALRGILQALAVPPDRIPADLAGQSALYRSALAGRRVLVLLDNARDTEQVRPLLPGAAGCLVLVTSRNRLSGLIIAVGAHALPLGLLADRDARELLAGRLGASRVAAEPHAVDDIVRRCVGLPMALALVAARAAAHPQVALAAVTDELRSAEGPLDAFACDEGPDLRALFSWSYASIGLGAGRLFRLLGLHPGPDFAAPAAASLLGVPVREVRPLLAELTRAHLVFEHVPGRYTCHDLLRAYAVELLGSENDDARAAALYRLFDHYLHTAYAAARLLRPLREPIALPPAEPGAVREQVVDEERALLWFRAEHAGLIAMVELAASTGAHAHTWQLAWTLTEFFDRQGHWHDWARIQRVALRAAIGLPDPIAQAHTHRDLGCAYAQLGRIADAEAQLRTALDRYEQAGDLRQQAYTCHSLGAVLERQGRYQAALDVAQRGLELIEVVGDPSAAAMAIAAIGWYRDHLGQHREAVDDCERALAIQRRIGDRRGQASTWGSLGTAHQHLGRQQQAVRCYRHAIELYQSLGDRYYEARIWIELGEVHQRADNREDARDAWKLALEILDALDHPAAEQIRDRLRHL
ncbi:BTAD domain-containing putative transcriptional regulator [Plantactinospora veratri]|uniref:BTAD domain-containing putative transcriptional regulator n=1 Tax=Plantactinospora veratri TaxID=1436122 RepID=A0ABU7SKE8_9ACTN